ncbi:hypothetical protein PPL_11860 [Heterostelium album PN500]|uniref:Uncharacterized protein n=1 Tax=Heterostelium pallidum (strain ATCC 26659 / Pp 5 / PN500) TaxID=670386 RepID=D3BUN9_HETP5|nr:hypothetical protein PPL_11860 [Heterostelium album PN500]EFA74827.1 hypothetical protein PPL_11860 [Heterostelium album PN500]|eukprot:XP_020426961.1 hypothetical protein PPL_11860 [Heterostelium album PN500]
MNILSDSASTLNNQNNSNNNNNNNNNLIYKIINYDEQTESFINDWLNHLITVFVDTPYQYFKEHHYSDPYKQKNNNEKIVSTVKLFIRDILLIGSSITCFGGIGEVSTNVNYRGRSLSIKLLDMALEYMNENNIKLGLLFSSKFAPMYHSKGWSYIDRSFTIETFHNINNNNNDKDNNNINNYNNSFDNNNLKFEQLYSNTLKEDDHHHHHSIIESLLHTKQYNSNVVRDISYWRDWIASNISPSLNSNKGWLLSCNGLIVGFIITGIFKIYETNDKKPTIMMVVKDIAINEKWRDDNTVEREAIIIKLIQLAFDSLKQQQQQSTPEEEILSIQYPTTLFSNLFNNNNKQTNVIFNPLNSTIQHRVDKSMMARFVSDKSISNEQTSLANLFPLESTIYWDIDKF